MDVKMNLCNCVESFRELADEAKTEEMRSKLTELTDYLAKVSEPDCAKQLTPDLKCIYDQATRCNDSPDSESCNRLYAHA
ncbi:MAG: hypothetical protein HY900_05210, partial [Deltaproteobacteria bacterium]|nr:hypothetical protein [Deltaproteobacteria bacterium]